MAGVQYELDSAEALRGLRHLSAWQIDALAYNAGALLESSVQRRISAEKTSPDGAAWAPWAEATAAGRGTGQSLLVAAGHLLGSVQNVSSGPEARVGTNLVYSAIHQFGGQAGRGRSVTIPARPYLGLSGRDRRDILDLVEGEIRELLA